MSIRIPISASTEGCWESAERLRRALNDADAVVIGAGAGLSASAGMAYSGERFQTNFADFIAQYHFADMYSAGFYPYAAPEEHWAFWSRYIKLNRYDPIPKPTYEQLLSLVKDKDYFVITTNVDHCFQRAGFDKARLFYTQGDYGLWQCAKPCHDKTYGNEARVMEMVATQRDRRIPTELLPRCPVCGEPMSMNLRADNTFVEDAGWHEANGRYEAFLQRHGKSKVVYLELGVGYNTPGIIKLPFWQMTLENKRAVFATINAEEAYVPEEIQPRSICLAEDITTVLVGLK